MVDEGAVRGYVLWSDPTVPRSARYYADRITERLDRMERLLA